MAKKATVASIRARNQRKLKKTLKGAGKAVGETVTMPIEAAGKAVGSTVTAIKKDWAKSKRQGKKVNTMLRASMARKGRK